MKRAPRLLIGLAVSALALGACGGDDDDTTTTLPGAVTVPAEIGGVTVPDEIAGMTIPDVSMPALGDDMIGQALVAGLQAERFEIVDGSIHVYMPAGSTNPLHTDATAACAAGDAVTESPIVIHTADGTETPC